MNPERLALIRESLDSDKHPLITMDAADVRALLDAAAERDRLAAKLDAVRALHPREVIAVHEFGPEALCPTCELHYPCPTIRAIDATEAS